MAGLSPGMVSNALSAYQARAAQAQASKQNIASGISQFGSSIAGGIKGAAEREAALKAFQLQQAQSEFEFGARERMQKQAQEFQAQQAREEANTARIDETLNLARQDRQREQTLKAYQAAGVKLPGEASGMQASAIGPLANVVMEKEQEQRGQQQFGAMIAPTQRQIPNALGFPMQPGASMPTGTFPASPRDVATRAGSMPGVNPEMAKRAMEFAQAQQGKPAKVDPYSQEVFDRRSELEKQKAAAAEALAKTGIEGRAGLQQGQQTFAREMQEDEQAFRREIETAKLAANPEQQRIALDKLRLRKQGLPVLIQKASEAAQYGRTPEDREAAKTKLAKYETQLAEIDSQLESPQTPPASQSGADQPTPEEMQQMTQQGYRWDAARGGFVR